MSTEHYLYPIGLDVLYDNTARRIVDRRLLTRDIFGDLPEYAVTAEDGTLEWVSEADLAPLDEDTLREGA